MEKESSRDMRQVRSTAAQLLFDIMEKGAYANLALDKTLKHVSFAAVHRNLLTEIVNGSVRMIKHLDWVLNLFLKSPLEQQNPWLRNILRVSLYQLRFMDRMADYACVNDAVAITQEKTNRNLGKVCNGVLRNIIRNQDNIKYPPGNSPEFLSVYYSHPEWMVRLFIDIYGYKESQKLLEFDNHRPELVFRWNQLKESREELLVMLKEEGVTCRASSATPWGIKVEGLEKSIPALNAYQKGYFYIQNEGSMLAPAILNPAKDSFIIDLCCGVGGKTTHLAEYMYNQGRIMAFDLYDKKVALLEQNCMRLGIDIVQAAPENILDLNPDNIKASYVLLDAPCSGLGVLNRRADARWRKTTEELKALTELQAIMLAKASSFLQEAGLLLYSTCTINPAENEEIVKGFLKNNPNFELQGFADHILFFPLDNGDKEIAKRGMLTIMPGKYDTDGMFYALMRRKS
ncbi:MAG: 16S rRNA (cytosine(967)-C(5))-methyltransferase RsmB [Syntrophomonas sp.]